MQPTDYWFCNLLPLFQLEIPIPNYNLSDQLYKQGNSALSNKNEFLRKQWTFLYVFFNNKSISFFIGLFKRPETVI